MLPPLRTRFVATHLAFVASSTLTATQLKELLSVPTDQTVVFERYSDSASSWVKLDAANIAVYKQLYRAAKAKLKLRIKATVVPGPDCT